MGCSSLFQMYFHQIKDVEFILAITTNLIISFFSPSVSLKATVEEYQSVNLAINGIGFHYNI